MKPDPVMTESAHHRQLGAICWRMKRGQVQILLITSRETQRHVVPKGWPIKGMPDGELIALEAWEEAGATGTVGPLLGTYDYDKVQFRGTSREVRLPCRVEVHAFHVKDLARRFPERKQRRRKWYSVAKASRRVDEPGLALLLTGFTPPDV